MLATTRVCVGVLGLCTLAMAHATDLLPGATAPKLEVKSWIKGTPVTSFEKNKVYVVEFWATWCIPCKQSIPHLTELAKKNKDVTFIGVSVDGKEDKVAPFVKAMGEQMDYSVAYGGNADGMVQTWMKAAGQNGIPTAFIVQGGKVVWIGHPITMDESLEQVQSGTLDIQASRRQVQVQIESLKKEREFDAKIEDLQKLHKAGKTKRATAELIQLINANPMFRNTGERLLNVWQALDDPVACEKTIDRLAKVNDNQSRMKLFDLAVSLLGEPKGKPIAMKAVEGVAAGLMDNDLTGRYQVAYAFHQWKENAKALEYIDKAIAMVPDSQYKDNADFKKELEDLREEIRKG